MYEQATKQLRDVYFPDITNTDAVKRGNVDLISDLNFGYGVLKAAILQTSVNNNGTASENKNTFLFRLSSSIDKTQFYDHF